jgi:hypothetical protein
VIADIPMNGDISSGCCRDGSDDAMTKSRLTDQVQVDPSTQGKVVDTFAQGSRDGLGGVD